MTGRISVSCENISSVTFILGTEKGMKLAQIFDEMKNILFYNAGINIQYTIFYQVYGTFFYIENDAEIFPAHSTWKVAEKGFKLAFGMDKLAMINSCEIFLEK